MIRGFEGDIPLQKPNPFGHPLDRLPVFHCGLLKDVCKQSVALPIAMNAALYIVMQSREVIRHRSVESGHSIFTYRFCLSCQRVHYGRQCHMR
jgi:hypothetical protein